MKVRVMTVGLEVTTIKDDVPFHTVPNFVKTKGLM